MYTCIQAWQLSFMQWFQEEKEREKCTKISTRGPRMRNGTTYVQNIYVCFLLIVFWWLFGIISLNSSSVLLLSMECWKHTALYNSDPVDTQPRGLLHHHREFHVNYIFIKIVFPYLRIRVLLKLLTKGYVNLVNHNNSKSW